MREIKFRGMYPYWEDTDLKSPWIIGYLGFNEEGDEDEYYIQSREQETGMCGYGEGYQITKETIGQYTGLKDKNRKEIYEGDIVEYYSVYGEEGNTRLGEVEFAEGMFTIKGIIKFLGKDCEVIGNIYENPGLLQGE